MCLSFGAARGASRGISASAVSSVEFRKIPEHEALNRYDVGRCLACRRVNDCFYEAPAHVAMAASFHLPSIFSRK